MKSVSNREFGEFQAIELDSDLWLDKARMGSYPNSLDRQSLMINHQFLKLIGIANQWIQQEPSCR